MGWLEKWGLKLTSAKVDVEVEAELGNIFQANAIIYSSKPSLTKYLGQLVGFNTNILNRYSKFNTVPNTLEESKCQIMIFCPSVLNKMQIRILEKFSNFTLVWQNVAVLLCRCNPHKLSASLLAMGLISFIIYWL